MNSKHIMIIAGEASGDHHAAKLISEIKSKYPNTKITGVGGEQMRQAGAEIYFDLAKLGIMGIAEVFYSIIKIFKIFYFLLNKLKTDKPDLLILVDYPGFNLRLAKKAHKLGIKTLYYISPQVWAWKEGRIKTIKKCIDKMAVILPFEVDYFKKKNVPVTFVGNPLTETVKPLLSSEQAKEAFDLNQERTIALLPGSRMTEYKKLLPVILESAKKIAATYPNTKFLLPLASTRTEKDLRPFLDGCNLNLTIVKNKMYDVLANSDAVICTSGTATLETTLIGTPMVIIYKSSFISYCIGYLLIKVKYAGLCNLLANEMFVKELLQYDVTPENISAEIFKLLEDKQYYSDMKNKMAEISQQLQTSNVEQSLFAVVEEMV